MGPAPAVASVRNAVRVCLTDLSPGDLVLAACSGGADSLALAAALAFVAPRAGLRAGGVTVDHGLQDGSAERAQSVAAALSGLGLDPVRRVAVRVARAGGPEAAARTARYEALSRAAAELGAAAVLLGHTLDDQAETVLLGLARGSGARSLAGMPPRRGVFRRPLLGLRRPVMAAACAALGLDPWRDPHNADRRFARVRVRLDALPALEAALGPGVPQALARTADQLRADAEVLENISAERARGDSPLSAPVPARGGPGGRGERGAPGDTEAGAPVPETGAPRAEGLSPRRPLLCASALAELPGAVRTRVLRSAALAAGCPAGALTAGHVASLEALVTDWHGQRWIDLPGGVRASRRAGELCFET